MNAFALMGIGVSSLFGSASTNSVWVVGAVRQPGVYSYREGMRVMDALAICRGEIPRVTRISDVKVIRRSVDGSGFKTIRVNLLRLMIRPFDDTQNVTIAAGDWIILGQVARTVR